MKALCWEKAGSVKVESVPDPKILNPGDVIVRITTTAICGSDLHLFDGYIPSMKAGDILGHEFMGEVVETGGSVQRLKVGDRVVVPFTIGCGRCYFCENNLWSLCDNSNPNAAMAEKVNGFSTAGLFGYSHLYGGYSGGQAEYARSVPFADYGPIKVPSDLSDEQVLFLSDILPTGYMAAENGGIKLGDTVAVWGCGPVGQFAIRSAFLLGAERVVAIDGYPNRLEMARAGKAEVLNYHSVDIVDALKRMTGGMGPDVCIDCVGLEAYGHAADALLDKVKASMFLATDRPHALRQAITACRKGGTVSIPGVYAGLVDMFPLGMAFAKGLTFKMGQTHVQKYMGPLLERIHEGDIDTTFLITHRLKLADAALGYTTFKTRQDECIKVVLTP